MGINVKMKLFIVALLVAMASASDDKIVNGVEQEPHSVPFIANIKRSGSLMCGGSLVTTKYIISAAHCEYSTPSVLTITVGDVTLGTAESTEQVFRVVRQIVHEDYGATTAQEHDIMLIELDGKVSLNENVQTVNLPSASPLVGTTCTVYGWGTTSSGGSISNKLMGVNVPVIDNADCETYVLYRGQIKPGMVCMGFLEDGGYDSCQGDSGGPAICNGELAGVVSWGVSCAEPKYPGVYTRVATYVDWIYSNAV